MSDGVSDEIFLLISVVVVAMLLLLSLKANDDDCGNERKNESKGTDEDAIDDVRR